MSLNQRQPPEPHDSHPNTSSSCNCTTSSEGETETTSTTCTRMRMDQSSPSNNNSLLAGQRRRRAPPTTTQTTNTASVSNTSSTKMPSTQQTLPVTIRPPPADHDALGTFESSCRQSPSSSSSFSFLGCFLRATTTGKKRQRRRRPRRNVRWLWQGILVLTILSRTLWHFYRMHQHSGFYHIVDEHSRIMLEKQQQQHQQLSSSFSNYNNNKSWIRMGGNANHQDVSIKGGAADTEASFLWGNSPDLSDAWKVLLQQRRLQRRERTRPPTATSDTTKDWLSATNSSIRIHHQHQESTIRIVDTDSDQDDHPDRDWKSLCQAANLTSHSRVVITGIVAHPVAAATALLLSHQCGVKHVAGVDHLFPNRRQERVHAMQRVYRTLYRSIKDFRLVVPTVTAGLARHNGEGLQWLPAFRPTHIVHMETTAASAVAPSADCRRTFNEDDDVDDELLLLSRSNERLYRMRDSSLTLRQLLEYARHPAVPVSMLHVVMGAATTTAAHKVDDTIRTMTQQQQERHRVMTETFFAQTNGTVTMNTLELPAAFYGPMILSTSSSSSCAETTAKGAAATAMEHLTSPLFVDDAVASILEALHTSRFQKLQSMTVDVTVGSSSKTSAANITSATPTAAAMLHQRSHDRQAAAFQYDQDFPYGVMATQGRVRQQSVAEFDATDAQRYRDTYGMHQTRFPCASSCANGPASLACELTVFDHHGVLAASHAATKGCQYVVYLVDFSLDLEELFEPQMTGSGSNPRLCRLVFVSGKSPLAERAIAERVKADHLTLSSSTNNNDNNKKSSDTSSLTQDEALQLYNGRIKSSYWTLVWLPHDDESTLTDAELALLRIEPGRFFAPSVSKAMYTESQVFAEPTDYALLRILSQLDRRPIPRHTVQERRSGVSVTRWVERPAERGRAVALFASEAPYQPISASEYAKLAANVTTATSLPRRQLVFYRQAAHWVQTNLHRPEIENKKQVYKLFPFQWISLGLLVHDLHMEQARTLRCSWYDEHLYWGSNRFADELSFAWLVGVRRIEQSLGPGLMEDPSWVPLLEKKGGAAGDEELQRDVDKRGFEVFLRFLQRSKAPESD